MLIQKSNFKIQLFLLIYDLLLIYDFVIVLFLLLPLLIQMIK